MSWDVLVIDIPVGAARPADVPDGFVPRPVGTRDGLVRAAASVAPVLDLTEPGWVVAAGESWSVELALDDGDPVYSVLLHVRGDEAVLAFLGDLLEVWGCRAWDVAADEVVDADSIRGTTSLAQWRTYRERVLGHR